MCPVHSQQPSCNGHNWTGYQKSRNWRASKSLEQKIWPLSCNRRHNVSYHGVQKNIRARVNQHPQTHHHEWTVHRQDAFFSLGSCSPGNLPIDDSSKSVPRVLKLGFIQLDGLKTQKWGWYVCGCWVTPAKNISSTCFAQHFSICLSFSRRLVIPFTLTSWSVPWHTESDSLIP